MTTVTVRQRLERVLWFAQNSLPLWLKWQLQHLPQTTTTRCDLLKIHYLCGWNDNAMSRKKRWLLVVICSKFITFVVEMTTRHQVTRNKCKLWFAQNSLPLWLKWQQITKPQEEHNRCDLLKIHYLCGWNDNTPEIAPATLLVVICSKFITFVVEMTTQQQYAKDEKKLWFAQNSLPLWLKWQRSYLRCS